MWQLALHFRPYCVEDNATYTETHGVEIYQLVRYAGGYDAYYHSLNGAIILPAIQTDTKHFQQAVIMFLFDMGENVTSWQRRSEAFRQEIARLLDVSYNK